MQFILAQLTNTSQNKNIFKINKSEDMVIMVDSQKVSTTIPSATDAKFFATIRIAAIFCQKKCETLATNANC